MWLEVRSPALWVKAGWLPAVLSGRLVGDIGEEAFNPHLEIGVWTQLKAAAGYMYFEGGQNEATADTIRADDLSEGGSERRELRPIWGRHSQFNIKYQKYHSNSSHPSFPLGIRMFVPYVCVYFCFANKFI